MRNITHPRYASCISLPGLDTGGWQGKVRTEKKWHHLYSHMQPLVNLVNSRHSYGNSARMKGTHFVCSSVWFIRSILYTFHIDFFNVGSIAHMWEILTGFMKIIQIKGACEYLQSLLTTLAHSLNEPCKLGVMVHNMLTVPNCYAKEDVWLVSYVLDKYYPCHEKYELVRTKNVPQYKWYFYQSYHFSMLIVLMLACLLWHSLWSVGWPQAEQPILLDKSLIRPKTAMNLLSKQGGVVKVYFLICATALCCSPESY